MRVIVADTYNLYLVNSKDAFFPLKYKNYKILWDMRDALFELWEGNVTKLALPELGTPGYDFLEFIDKMVEIGQIEKKPKIEYYQFETKKS